MTTVAACDNLMPAYADAVVDCGYGEPMDCTCASGTTQNSHELMTSAVGPASCLP